MFLWPRPSERERGFGQHEAMIAEPVRAGVGAGHALIEGALH